MRKFILWVLLCASLCGCSVGMAMSGKENPQLGAVRVGATRGEIELHLGPPIQTRSVDDKRIDTYEYEVGNEPSPGRAVGHGIMDVLTLGLWEVVGTPVEGVQGQKQRLDITYDENDVVTHVGSVSAPPKNTAPPKTTEKATSR